jgi:hypothetical protein
MVMVSLVGAAALVTSSFGAPASAQDAKSVIRTLNAILNPEDAWRLEDQARRYEHHDETRYWHDYAAGLQRQRHEQREREREYGREWRYSTPIDPGEAYRLREQAHRFNRREDEQYWEQYREGLERRR